MKYIIGCVLVLLGFTACKRSFLEATPKGVVIATTTSDYNLQLNSPYLAIGAFDPVMGDEIVSMEPFYSSLSLIPYFKRKFDWDADVYQPGEVASEMQLVMQALYAYNAIINEVMDSKGGTEQEKLSIQAEAKAGRAWTNFMMINAFGKPYDATTSATDPGFPIITVADVTQTKFSRGTVKEMYDFIVKDLTEAIPYLPVNISARIRMSKPAAEALLGKVYTFMHRYQDAIPLFNASIAALPSSGIPVRLYDYNTAFLPGGVFTPTTITGPTQPLTQQNEENMYTKTFSNAFRFSFNGAFLAPWAFALFHPADQRLNLYTNMPYGGTTPFVVPGVRKKLAGTQMDAGIIVPDVYLLRAECKARTGDTTGAKADLLTLRTKRMPTAAAALPGGLDQTGWIQYVLDERVREFAIEYFRWFDMRRLSVDPLFKNKTYTHVVYNTDGSVLKTITLKPERLTLRFPPDLMEQNPGMINNP